MKKTTLIITICLFVSSSLSAPIWAEIYKYVDRDGNTIFTDDLSKVPIDGRKKAEQMLETKSTPTKEDAYSKKSSGVKNELSYSDIQFINTLREKGLSIPDEDQSPEYVHLLKKSIEENYGIKDIRNWHPNPNFSSPESTWQFHRQAMKEGKINKALDCFVAKSRDRFKNIFQGVGPAGVSKMAQEMNPIQKITGDQTYAKYRLVRNESIKGEIFPITYYVYFLHFLGEWKIRQY